MVWAVQMTLSKAEKLRLTPVYWKFTCGLPSLFPWHLISHSSCVRCPATGVHCRVTMLRLIPSVWTAWIGEEILASCAPHLTRGAAHIFVGVFELVNHRKVLPLNLPLDLKDVCGFPLSHQPPQTWWGWRDVILVHALNPEQLVMTSQIKAGLRIQAKEK